MRITSKAMCQKRDGLDKQILQCRSQLSKICPAILVLSICTKIQQVNSKLFNHLHQIKAHSIVVTIKIEVDSPKRPVCLLRFFRQ